MFVFIIISCILMTFENPNLQVQSPELALALARIDFGLTLIFFIEAVLKIFAFGMVEYISKATNQVCSLDVKYCMIYTQICYIVCKLDLDIYMLIITFCIILEPIFSILLDI